MSASIPQTITRHDDRDQDELSDEQMKLLLHQAEHRLSHQNILPQPSRESLKSRALPQLRAKTLALPWVSMKHGIAQARPHQPLSVEDERIFNHARRMEGPFSTEERLNKEKDANAGFDFFNIPATRLSAELQADMRLLKVRGVLDPHRHYKKESSKDVLPRFSEVGKIIEGPTEHYSARLPKKDRKKTFVEEVLANEKSTGRFRNKYNQLQTSKASGKKAYHKKLRSKRYRGI